LGWTVGPLGGASLGVRHIKLHGGRHTAATLMHLDGVPVAVIAAWIGHSDPTMTLRVYVHSQADPLKAGTSLDGANKSSIGVVTLGDPEGPKRTHSNSV